MEIAFSMLILIVVNKYILFENQLAGHGLILKKMTI